MEEEKRNKEIDKANEKREGGKTMKQKRDKVKKERRTEERGCMINTAKQKKERER